MGFLFLWNWSIPQGGPHFDVAWVGHIWGDSTVGSIGSSATAGGSVDLRVVDGHVFAVQLFAVGVGDHVSNESQNDVDRLCWPSSLSKSKLFSLSGSSLT